MEGFNPSDDGVILAQSYRLLNGEIPHKDFIAIRPVFSGIVHSVSFFSPLPLIESSRWMVLVENMITAIFFSLILNLVYYSRNLSEKILLFLPVTLLTFLLNINIYTIYPWTTIDAIMFSIAGLYFYLKNFIGNQKFSFVRLSVGLLLFSISSLCRQTFALLFLIAVIYIIY
ncbi:MAG: hypothetical protein ABIJ97_17925, partial [Bacteroidota bacterium]